MSQCPECGHDMKAHNHGRCRATVYVHLGTALGYPATDIDYTYPCPCEERLDF